MRFVVITLPAVSDGQRGPSDGCALLNFHYERPESSLSFHIAVFFVFLFCVFWGGRGVTMSYLGGVQGETRGRSMMVILSRIAHGNVSICFHHGRTVDDVDAAVKLISRKIMHLIRIVLILSLHTSLGYMMAGA